MDCLIADSIYLAPANKLPLLACSNQYLFVLDQTSPAMASLSVCIGTRLSGVVVLSGDAIHIANKRVSLCICESWDARSLLFACLDLFVRIFQEQSA
jgi:hypothetical protein